VVSPLSETLLIKQQSPAESPDPAGDLFMSAFPKSIRKIGDVFVSFSIDSTLAK
jgi:hypothetical protein